MKEFRIALGKNIREIRKSKGLTLEMMKKKKVIARNQMSRIENAQVNVTVNSLYIISKALDVHISEFFNFDFEEGSCTQ
jgi:transcriptional regulator with XRE-family HTH domain